MMGPMKRKARNQVELYETMRSAIVYMREHAASHPTPAHVARMLGMSLSRFEHAFTEWVGTTPKRFLAHLSRERAKKLLQDSLDMIAVSHRVGLSGPGRLHELMVTYEAVSPGEWKSGEIDIVYGVHPSPFGLCFIAVTPRGICRLAFMEKVGDEEVEVKRLTKLWERSRITKDEGRTKPYIKKIFEQKKTTRPLHLLVKGTNFQIKVWEALLSIPSGSVARYADIAGRAGSSKAVRAVGTACGANPIAFLIPCHRVLTTGGDLGGYRWGEERKEVMLAWEAAQISPKGKAHP